MSMWAPDNSRGACTRCGSEFSWHRRRHHCRCCGGLFCDSCSNHFVPVNNPIAQPGAFSQVFADKNSGVHRVCFGCYHKYYAYICVYSGFFGSLKADVYSTIDEAAQNLEGYDKGIILHFGTAKIQRNKNPNDAATTAKMLERGKGKARKIMGETFYEEQAAANRPVMGPSLGQYMPGSATTTTTTTSSNNKGTTNNNNNNDDDDDSYNRFRNNNRTDFGSNPNNSSTRVNNNNNNSHNYQNQNQQPPQTNNIPLPSEPLPQFAYVVCVCLENGVRRLRFLQTDVHTDKAKLILEVQKLATEEFEAHGKFVDQKSFVEAVVLLDTNWKTSLFCGTARFYYRAQPYIDSTIEHIMKNQTFVICAHRGGRAQCDLVNGGAEARQKLFDCANNNISAVIVAPTGEPIGHTCRDVSWRRDLVDRADSDGLKLLHDGQNRVVFVASTIPSMNADVRVGQTLWDLEQVTSGQIRTTVQAWVWDPQAVDKKCIVTPFLGGSLAPPCVTPGQMDSVASAIRKVAVGMKSAAPVPSANNNNNNTGAAAAAAASSSPQTQQQPQNNNNNQAGGMHLTKLSAPPARPSAGASAGAVAAASPNDRSLSSTQVSQAPECPVCMDEFNAGTNKPLVLPCCGHSICAECVKGLMERKAANTNSVPCPRCREEIPVTQKLVPNRTLLEQIS